MKFGEFDVFALSDGMFALDGGAMFGVVPRVFWQKTNPPDDRNRISLALRPLLIKTPQALVLIDTGVGDFRNDKFRDIYRIQQPPTLPATLRAAGFAPENVTHVVNTHLHFDHAGGDTAPDGSGGFRPTFPKAKYYIQRREWELANRPDIRSRASYIPDDFRAIEAAGQLVLIDGAQEITPGVTVLHTGGHTGGHQSVVVEVKSQKSEVGGRKLVYWGDLIPTASHINVPYVMGYDTAPLQTIEQKERLLKSAAQEHWLMCFEHDPVVAFAFLRAENDKYIVEPIAAEGTTDEHRFDI
jgi:glyoxylase-like metal-dependent hydrolase (beta-lactamase superfamily II)